MNLKKVTQNQSDLSSKVRLIHISQLGINSDLFIRWIQPTFETLCWDYYDVRKQQIEFIQQHFQVNTNLTDYYLSPFKCKLDLLFKKMPIAAQEKFLQIVPWRRRACSHFIATKSKKTWHINYRELKYFSQKTRPSQKNDYRQLPRQFTIIPKLITNNLLYKKFLLGIIGFVEQQNPKINCLAITAHHISVITHADAQGRSTPEGIHKDGADYILSALVIERENITGGESYIYADDKKTVVFNRCLQPGEGILQEDEGSPLWHSATPISVIDSKKSGKRSIIGLDINIL